MAKRRSRKRRQRRQRPVAQPQVEAQSSVDLSEEYQYVAQDLSRIGIIAAILIAGLIALSFFL